MPRVLSAEVLSPFPHIDRCSWGTAISYKGGKRRDDHDKRHTYAYPGKRQGTDLWNMADVDPVYDIVEHIDDLCGLR